MTDQPTPQTEAGRECPGCGMAYAACVKARRTHIACCPDCEHPDQPTPQTHIAHWHLGEWCNACVMRGAAQARTEALDVDALAELVDAAATYLDSNRGPERWSTDRARLFAAIETARAIVAAKADR